MAKSNAPRVQGATRGKRPSPQRTEVGTSGKRGGVPTWVPVALAVALVVVLILLVINISGSDPLEDRARELRVEALVRDREQIEEVVDVTYEVRDEVVSVFSEFNTYLPDGDATVDTVDATPEQIESWQQTMAEIVEPYENEQSGATDTNLTRLSLGLAVDLFDEAVNTYALAAEADEDLQADLIARAGELRDFGIRTWSIGATQLDGITVNAELGHHHIYLEFDGGVGEDPAMDGLLDH